jgi:hypothetical protein
MTVSVVRIRRDAYPDFLADADHPFIALPTDARLAEIDAFASLIWARACAERVVPRPKTTRRLAA